MLCPLPEAQRVSCLVVAYFLIGICHTLVTHTSLSLLLLFPPSHSNYVTPTLTHTHQTMDLEVLTNANNAPESSSSNNNNNNGESTTSFFDDDYDSTCSTPYVSAPSSPGSSEPVFGFFYSAPGSPLHFTCSSSSYYETNPSSSSVPMGYEFEFLAQFGPTRPGSMSSADELFLNGQIRLMKLGTAAGAGSFTRSRRRGGGGKRTRQERS